MYQSRDKSEEETLTNARGDHVLDPQTDDEGPISCNAQMGVSKLGKWKPASHKPYLTRALAYRMAQVQFHSPANEISHMSSSAGE